MCWTLLIVGCVCLAMALATAMDAGYNKRGLSFVLSIVLTVLAIGFLPASVISVEVGYAANPTEDRTPEVMAVVEVIRPDVLGWTYIVVRDGTRTISPLRFIMCPSSEGDEFETGDLIALRGEKLVVVGRAIQPEVPPS